MAFKSFLSKHTDIGLAGNIFGRPEEAPQFVDPSLAEANRVAAIRSAQNRRALFDVYGGQSRDITNQLSELNAGPSSQQLAQQEIQRRRMALNTAGEGQRMDIGRSIARMNLGRSAAGQFALEKQRQDQERQQLDLESNQSNILEDIQNQQARRRAALAQQLSGIEQSAALPGIQYMTAPTEGTQGIAGGLLQGVGQFFGGRMGEQYAKRNK